MHPASLARWRTAQPRYTQSFEYGPPKIVTAAPFSTPPLRHPWPASSWSPPPKLAGLGAGGCRPTYGAAAGVSPARLQRRGRRINIFSVATALFLPWILFCVVYATMSFSLRYHQPFAAYGIVGVLLCMVVVFPGHHAAKEARSALVGSGGHATWAIFLFLTMLLSWSIAQELGWQNFSYNLKPFYDIVNLDTYPQVDPSTFRGQQLMDAGRIVFTPDSRLDLQRSMGFKNLDMYCVAPITVGNENVTYKALQSYDFWAVGLNCCGDRGDFKCGEFNNPNAHAGLRLMRDEMKPFFRLAVQQAESAFNIQAVHPMFVHFMQDPTAEAQAYQEDGFKYYLLGIFWHFVLQLTLVILACMVFHSLDNRVDTFSQNASPKMLAL